MNKKRASSDDSQAEARKKWISQIRKGGLEMCLLEIVSGRPQYGFAIIQHLNESGLTVSEGTIYPLLNRLQAEDLVEASWHESESGPPRKYYTLTHNGQSTLRWMREEWQRYTQAVESVFAAVPPQDTPAGQALEIQSRRQKRSN